jgi:hypothetical protein
MISQIIIRLKMIQAAVVLSMMTMVISLIDLNSQMILKMMRN